MNIILRQAVKLVEERWFSVEKAVDLAWETQERRWFIKQWKLTKRWQQYSNLSSEQRSKIRRLVEKGADIKDFTFTDNWFRYNKTS